MKPYKITFREQISAIVLFMAYIFLKKTHVKKYSILGFHLAWVKFIYVIKALSGHRNPYMCPNVQSNRKARNNSYIEIFLIALYSIE